MVWEVKLVFVHRADSSYCMTKTMAEDEEATKPCQKIGSLLCGCLRVANGSSRQSIRRVSVSCHMLATMAHAPLFAALGQGRIFRIETKTD